MKNVFQIISILTFSFLASAQGVDTYFCNKDLDSMPILQGGRIKPLSVHAKESLKHLVGKQKFEGLTHTQVYCLLSAKGIGLNPDIIPMATIEHVDSKKFLGDKDKIEYEKLVTLQSDIRTEWMRQKNDTSYKKDLSKILSKILLYQEVILANNWMLPVVKNAKVEWTPLLETLNEQAITELAKTSSNPFLDFFKNAKAQYIEIEGDSYMVEYYFDRASLTAWAMLVTLVALCALVLFKNFYVALGLSFLTVLIQTTYIILRIYISGRAPITNMYETVLFSGYGGLVLALIIGHFKKEKVFIYMGLAYNMCTLMMITFAGSMVSASIGPLVPVLRDNFWLSTHVTTIIMSYGALALSWILANTILFKSRFQTLSKADGVYYNAVIYTSLKYGVSMLAAGIILGGVWADYSWGRFWGWDPKETWSLIVLCFYMAILHGKYTNWIPTKRFAQLVAAAFMSVMMAWFGVNYILASGLHSYGFSEGGAIFLGSFFFIQIAFILITLKKEDVTKK